MKRYLMTILLLTGTAICTMAQTHIDALASTDEHIRRHGQQLSAEDFMPAAPLNFTPNEAPTADTMDAPIGRIVKHVPYKSAAVHYSYAASGTERESQKKESWTMQAGTLANGQTALLDVIPDGFDAGGFAVPYSIAGNTLTVQPTYLGSTSQYYVFLFAYDDSWSNFDLRITLDGKGAMEVDPNLNIVYGAFTTDHFDINAYQGYYESYSAVSYRKNVVLGDTNEDNVVDKADTQTLVNHLLNRSQDNADVDAMDTNADGSINVADVIGLSKIIKNQK